MDTQKRIKKLHQLINTPGAIQIPDHRNLEDIFKSEFAKAHAAGSALRLFPYQIAMLKALDVRVKPLNGHHGFENAIRVVPLDPPALNG